MENALSCCTTGPPGSQAHSRVAQLHEALQSGGFQVSRCELLSDLAGFIDGMPTTRAVICAGGDGTISAALNLLGDTAPLVPFPLGNENLLAKHLGIGSSVRDMLHLIQDGLAKAYDVASQGSHHFLLMLSCGFDADVVARVHRNRISHINKLAYVKEIGAALRHYRFRSIRIEVLDEYGHHQTLEGNWVFVFNCPSYARGFGIAPAADPHDGLLDICIFKGSRLLRNLGHFATVLMGIHGDWSGCIRMRGTYVGLRSEVPIPIQTDGDPSGQTSADVHIVPRGVRLVIPRSVA